MLLQLLAGSTLIPARIAAVYAGISKLLGWFQGMLQDALNSLLNIIDLSNISSNLNP
jgi:hypothetical protein